MDDVFVVDHDYGFFSCSSVALTNLIEYYNLFNITPPILDRSKQYSYYKRYDHDDVSSIIFKNNEEYIGNIEKPVNFHWDYQFIPYDLINFKGVLPFINKYFQPSEMMETIVSLSESALGIDYSKTLAVLYRGNDKIKEIPRADYSIFIEKIKTELDNNKHITTIFVQTDEQEFLDECFKFFDNVIYLEEIPRIYRNDELVIHNTVTTPNEKFKLATNILKSILMISKCNTILVTSGNCGIWPVLYRGNINNVFQYLNNYKNFEDKLILELCLEKYRYKFNYLRDNPLNGFRYG